MVFSSFNSMHNASIEGKIASLLSSLIKSLDTSWTPSYGNITSYYKFDDTAGSRTAINTISSANNGTVTSSGSFRYYKLEIISTQAADGYVQFADWKFYNNGAYVTCPTLAQESTKYQTNFGTTDGQTVSYGFNNVDTDKLCLPKPGAGTAAVLSPAGYIIIDFTTATSINSYTWVTGGDSPNIRDPITWRLYGSNDYNWATGGGSNGTWTTLHSVTNFAPPAARNTAVGTTWQIGGFIYGSTGIVDNAAYLTGGYATVPVAVLNNIASGTISCWVNLASISGSVICAKQRDLFNTIGMLSVGGYSAVSTGSWTTGTAGIIYWHANNSQSVIATSNSAIALNTWTHIAVTFTSTSASIYINGALNKTTALTNGSIPNDTTATITTSIGGWYTNSAINYSLNGYIDDFAVWNVALTSANLYTIYNRIYSRPVTVSATGTYTKTTSGLYTLYAFTSGTSTISFNVTVNCNVLIVGGGGGGGYGLSTHEGSGGGGAGGVGYGTLTLASSTTYTISIGNGGNAAVSTSATATSGSNTTFSGGSISETANGGGYGGSNINGSGQGGAGGGSGGGGSAGWNNSGFGATTKGSGTLTYLGNVGGAGINGGAGGGGGGATGAGTQPGSTAAAGGDGGAGYTWTSGGGSVIVGGGGGGGGGGSTYGNTNGGSGGSGVGGAGGSNGSRVGGAGTPNTGGGGGGGHGNAANGGAGGSGVVYIGILTSAISTSFSSGSITGLQLWLDAADPLNTGTAPSNSTISTWYDKSGSQRNATATGTITYNTTAFNSKPAMTFESSQYFTGNVPVTGSTMTTMAVFTMNSNTGGSGRIIGMSNAIGTFDYNNTISMSLSRTGNGIILYRNSASVSSSFPSYSTPYLVEAWFDGTNMRTTIQVGSGTAITSVASTENFGISKYVVGNSTAPGPAGEYWNGYISEIIVFNTSLSTTDREKMEGYLSWKWGIQANLPAAHPYRNAAPTF